MKKIISFCFLVALYIVGCSDVYARYDPDDGSMYSCNEQRVAISANLYTLANCPSVKVCHEIKAQKLRFDDDCAWRDEQDIRLEAENINEHRGN